MDIEEQYDKIYRFCFWKVHNRELAEDLTQETFLRYLSNPHDKQGKEMQYLYTIARNLCIDEWRRMEDSSDPEGEISDNGAASDAMDYMVQINQILDKLSSEDREILILRFVNEEPLTSICKVTGLSRFALYRRINSIKKEIQNIWQGGIQSE